MNPDTKAQILATSLNLFAEQGFGKTSMNDIIRATGMSKGGVYWHFPSKDALIHAVFKQFFEEQVNAFADLITQENLSATDKLMGLAKQGGAELAEMAGQFPSSLEFYALAINDSALQEMLVHFLNRYRDLIEQLITQGIQTEEWRNVDARAAANTLIALIEGVLLIWAMTPEAFRLDEQLEQSMALLLEGLKNHERGV